MACNKTVLERRCSPGDKDQAPTELRTEANRRDVVTFIVAATSEIVYQQYLSNKFNVEDLRSTNARFLTAQTVPLSHCYWSTMYGVLYDGLDPEI